VSNQKEVFFTTAPRYQTSQSRSNGPSWRRELRMQGSRC